ncbi:hypothetical protein OROHE_011505 [Orobanche hederae]
MPVKGDQNYWDFDSQVLPAILKLKVSFFSCYSQPFQVKARSANETHNDSWLDKDATHKSVFPNKEKYRSRIEDGEHITNEKKCKEKDFDCRVMGVDPGDAILFVISKPDVFKSPNSDTYVIFGEAKIEDLNSQLQTQAAEQFKAPNVGNAAPKPEPIKHGHFKLKILAVSCPRVASYFMCKKACLCRVPVSCPVSTHVSVLPRPEPTIEPLFDDEDVDESGVEPKDIELVMTQAGVSRARAVKALKESDGDIVSAIMELTN